MRGYRALVGAFFGFLLVTNGTSAHAAILSLIGSSQKVCQVTGDVDWDTNTPTPAQTKTNFGLDAADLGFPVDTGGSQLYILFGDSWPPGHPPPPLLEAPPDDSVGTSTLSTTPVAASCLQMQMLTSAPKTWARPTVTPTILQGFFDVPSGGVYVNNSLFEFFWTNHCAFPGVLAPQPGDPLGLPAVPTCAELPGLNSVGASVLGQSTSSPVLFNQPTSGGKTVTMPSGFVYVSAVDANHAPDLAPPSQQLGVFIYGVPRYRASVPFLAYAPEATFADPSTWSFFAGMTGASPHWVSRTIWESGKNGFGRWIPPANAEIYDPGSDAERCVGEHSVTWNAPLHEWLLLYGCGLTGVEARFSPAPWGPWSEPTVLLSYSPSVYCTLIMNLAGCPSLTRRNDWPGMQGFFYAPFIINRFTTSTAAPYPPFFAARANIYWLVSTWNPYAVVLMHSTLQVNYRLPIPRPPIPTCKGTRCY